MSDRLPEPLRCCACNSTDVFAVWGDEHYTCKTCKGQFPIKSAASRLFAQYSGGDAARIAELEQERDHWKGVAETAIARDKAGLRQAADRMAEALEKCVQYSTSMWLHDMGTDALTAYRALEKPQ